MTFKKIVGNLHLWLGLMSGLVVFIIGLSGAAYVFTDEIKPALHRDLFYIKPGQHAAMPLSKLLAAAQKTLGDRPVSRVEIFNQPDRTYTFRSWKINPEALTYWGYYQYYYRVYVNPYNGEVVGVENTKTDIFQLLLGLHMWMLLGVKLGHYVVGGAVLIFVLLLCSGLVLWWPKKWNKAARQKNFRVQWKANAKRLNYDLHNVIGFYASIVLLMISLTGLVFVFEWMENSVRFLANGAKTIEETKLMSSDTVFSKRGSGVDAAIFEANFRNPGANSYLVTLPSKPAGAITISSYMKNWNKYDRVQESYDRYTGKLLRSAPFNSLNNGDKIYQLNYDLHTGSILGLPGKVLAFFASLVAASLPVTGFSIWWGRKKKRKRPVVVVY